MSSDQEAQQDEVLALESIFEGDVFQVHPGDIVSGQLKIRVELTDPFFVAIETEPDPNDETMLVIPGITIGNEARYPIEHMPPLTLHFTLPKAYPSETKPNFTLSAVWLHRTSLSILCERLDELWEENKGMGILFTWANFLQSNVLQELYISDFFDVAWVQQPRHLNKRRNPFYVPRKPRRSTAENSNILNAVATPAEKENTPETEDAAGEADKTIDEGNSSKSQKGKRRKTKPAKKTKQSFDARAATEAIPRQDGKQIELIDYLLSYNEEHGRELYLQSSHCCEICYNIKMGHDCVRFLCSHVFCKECVKQYFTSNIQEGNVDLVKCLGFNCKIRPSTDLVKNLVGEELFERYDGILLKRALESMSDITYCPRPKCHNPVICDPNEKCAFCSVCSYTFCSVCKMVYHGVEPCRFKDADMKEVFRKYTEGTPAEKKALLNAYGKKQLGLLVDNILSEQWVQKESKPCPHCKVPIEKYEGCNKVTCFKCNTYFCWLCCKQLEHGNPYFHFNDPSSKCYNNLFQDMDIEVGGNEWFMVDDTDTSDDDMDDLLEFDDDDEDDDNAEFDPYPIY